LILEQEMVIFYTMAFNAEKTLPRTIQSVLNQTERDWIWYLIDNGSQDATWQVAEKYAAQDSRIIPRRNIKNMVFTTDTSPTELPWRHDDLDWYCFLDADDEYKPRFLEEMLAFIHKYQLDVAACGFDFIKCQTGEVTAQRILQRDLVITEPRDFGEYFPIYHHSMRTNWGKLFSVRVTKKIDYSKTPSLFYGTDTLYTQEMLRNSNRFGVLARSLHKYYVYPKSRSYQWQPDRFKADQILYELACSYLVDKCGTVSAENRNFLQRVYANAITDTTKVIQDSALSPSEKLREYRAIASHSLTQAAYRECKHNDACNSKAVLMKRALLAGIDLRKENDKNLRTVAQTLCPCCGRAVSTSNARLFLETPELFHALIQDEQETLLQNFLDRMEKNQGVKKYAIPEAIHALAAEHPLLFWIDDAVFLRKYRRVYWKVWKNENLDALDEMTSLLLENQVTSGKETFLNLYISLAAAEEQASAFIFGKLQLAKLYLHQSRIKECQSIVNDLVEIGLDCDELDELKQAASLT